jgi:hypothetical protein
MNYSNEIKKKDIKEMVIEELKGIHHVLIRHNINDLLAR